VLIIDSIGAATEGVSEKEGKQTQQYLATLKPDFDTNRYIFPDG